MQKIIGFSGKKGSGKDTLARFLLDNSFKLFGVDAATHSFAGNLKKVCIDFFGLNRNHVYGNEDDKNSLTKYKWENLPINKEGKTGFMTAREFIQIFGTEIARKMNPYVHIESCFRNIWSKKSALNFITDVRFLNEVKSIQEIGGIVIRLTRESYSDNHQSEIELDNNMHIFDLVLDNKFLSKEDQSKELINKLKEIGWIK